MSLYTLEKYHASAPEYATFGYASRYTPTKPLVSVHDTSDNCPPRVSYGFSEVNSSEMEVAKKLAGYQQKKRDLFRLQNKSNQQEKDKASVLVDVHDPETVEDYMKDLVNNRTECWNNIGKKCLPRKRRRDIEEGSYPNCSVDDNKLPSLMRFVWKGKVEKVRHYLADSAKHAKVNRQDAIGRSALHFAASWGCVDTMKQLLQIPGIDVNIKDGQYKTPLFKAAEVNSLECVKLLLEAGANPTTTVRDGRILLEYIMQEYGDARLEIFELLFSVCRPKRKGERSLTLLHKLCLARRRVSVESVADFLVEKEGVDMNAVDGKGRTPLMIATMVRRSEVMRCLLRNFADVNVYDDELKSVVSYAKKGTYHYELLRGCVGKRDVRVIRYDAKEGGDRLKQKEGHIKLPATLH